MVPPIVLGGVATVVVGLVAAFFMLAPPDGRLKIWGLAAAFVLAALYVARSGLSDKAAGYWLDGGGGDDGG